jgi:hypothetical protein
MALQSNKYNILCYYIHDTTHHEGSSIWYNMSLVIVWSNLE